MRIGGKSILCRGREIVLADDEKIICFGYATHDSELTKVVPETKDVLFLIYGTQAVTNRIMNSAIRITTDMIDRWIDCSMIDRRVFRIA